MQQKGVDSDFKLNIELPYVDVALQQEA